MIGSAGYTVDEGWLITYSVLVYGGALDDS